MAEQERCSERERRHARSHSQSPTEMSSPQGDCLTPTLGTVRCAMAGKKVIGCDFLTTRSLIFPSSLRLALLVSEAEDKFLPVAWGERWGLCSHGQRKELGEAGTRHHTQAHLPDDTPVAAAKNMPGASADLFGDGTAEDGSAANGRLWRTVIIGEQEHRIDLHMIRPYMRVVTHGGEAGCPPPRLQLGNWSPISGPL